MSGVVKGSPAEKAGIRQGDVILQYNGKLVQDTAHLRNMVSQTPVGTRVKVKLLRKKKETTVEAMIAELPKKTAEVVPGGRAGERESSALAGTVVREVTPEIARRFGMGKDEKGVVIVKVAGDSRAFEAGLRPGDIVLQVNHADIVTLEDYNAAIGNLSND
ncbi:MAG TPA: hypothetical protein DCS42_15960, partial [Nitrospiraceae bacterium]|nr:hypothetical protein [Nitrospiraceae bacterium]